MSLSAAHLIIFHFSSCATRPYAFKSGEFPSSRGDPPPGQSVSLIFWPLLVPGRQLGACSLSVSPCLWAICYEALCRLRLLWEPAKGGGYGYAGTHSLFSEQIIIASSSRRSFCSKGPLLSDGQLVGLDRQGKVVEPPPDLTYLLERATKSQLLVVP